MGIEGVEPQLEPQLQAAREKFEGLGIACETFKRGGNLAPWLKVVVDGQEVYVAYQYGKLVSTDLIPGVQTTAAGLGEFEYYLHFPKMT